jgi:hypothetical protein
MLRGTLILVDQAAEHRSALDPLTAEMIYNGVVRSRWPELAGAVRPAAVVVADVFRQYRTEVPFTEDQQSVGEFGSEGVYESFGEGVRPRAARGSFDHAKAASARTASKDVVN